MAMPIDLMISKWPENCLVVATRYMMREITVDMKGPIRLLFPCMVNFDDKSYTEISTTKLDLESERDSRA